MSGEPARPPKQSWERLTGHRHQPSAAVPDGDTVEEMVMRAVSGGEGERLLDWMRSQTIDAPAIPHAPEAELRAREGQRALVQRIENMRDRGVEISRKRKQPR